MISKRLACCLVPNYSVELILKEKPQLRSKPVALAKGRHPTAPLVAVNSLAAEEMVTVGMTIARAHTRCQQLVILSCDDLKERRESKKLLRALTKVGPFIEPETPGIYFLEAAGFERLYGGEEKLADRIINTVGRFRLPVTVGTGANKYIAKVAAQVSQLGSFTIVPDQAEREFLSQLDIKYLHLSDDTIETLQALGLKSVSQVAPFAGNEMALRFGAEGTLLANRSHGHDKQFFVPITPTDDLTERVVLDFPIRDKAAIIAHIEQLLKRLFQRFKSGTSQNKLTVSGAMPAAVSAVGCDCVEVKLLLENNKTVPQGKPAVQEKPAVLEVSGQVERPVASAGIFIRQLNVQMERLRLSSGVIEIILSIPRLSALVPEQITFDKSGGAGANKAGYAGVGGRFYVPRLKATFLPEHTFSLVDMISTTMSNKRSRAASDATWCHPYALHQIAGLRLLSPPKEIKVTTDGARPRRIYAGRRKGYRSISQQFGPWYLSGGWWNGSFDRQYYEVVTEQQQMYLLFYDRLSSRWFVQGMFD
jgi:nucleotidyltransferase/DNA polymerase involved in DNA repair